MQIIRFLKLHSKLFCLIFCSLFYHFKHKLVCSSTRYCFCKGDVAVKTKSSISLCRVFNICVILSIELSVLSQFQIPLKLRRRVIIARIIRSGYHLIKAWKRLASAKTLQTHFNNRIIYSQKWYFTTSKNNTEMGIP